jgi:hypothetical protein
LSAKRRGSDERDYGTCTVNAEMPSQKPIWFTMKPACAVRASENSRQPSRSADCATPASRWRKWAAVLMDVSSGRGGGPGYCGANTANHAKSAEESLIALAKIVRQVLLETW